MLTWNYRRAEFPLQWLGECLIHHSILYEGNPDTTNIQERFRYKFEVPPPPTAEQPAALEVNGTAEKMDETTGTEGAVAVEATTMEQQMASGEQEIDTNTEEQAPAPPAETTVQDTEMGGTS
jgi:hypothetical protein